VKHARRVLLAALIAVVTGVRLLAVKIDREVP
jgi:hypothetical protein